MSVVYWCKTTYYKNFVRKVVDIFADDLLTAGRILLKPNLVSAEAYPTTTHPRLLEIVLEELKNLKISEVVVADGPAFNAPEIETIFSSSAIRDVCVRFGVPLVNLYETKSESVTSPRDFTFSLFEYPLQFDYVISLPVLKEHTHTKLTGALKNQFGYLARFERLKVHSPLKSLPKVIAEVNAYAKTDLFVVDAMETLVDAQEIRHGGIKRNLGYMLAGKDPVALDSFGLNLLKRVDAKLENLGPANIEHIKLAEKYGVGNLEYESEELCS
ncbi:MAG: DUF362 domain-containing protein [Patescibacteria group bacterium]|nr:DUF362 domain-containing protein [Patescibacteria group bacterium]